MEAQSSESTITSRKALGRDLTTFAIGGELTQLFEPDSIVQLSELIRGYGSDRITIGGGSNILISDEGISKPVVRLGRGFNNIEPLGGGKFFVGASTSLMNLSRKLSDDGWSGLEFAGGIPASFGGAVMMNAGAHGDEIVTVLSKIQIVNGEGEALWVDPKSFEFKYRLSGIPKENIVIGAEISLIESTKEKTSLLRKTHLEERKKRQPLASPSAGSVFKNPPGEFSAGALIEKAGLKGAKIGGAEISQLHGNWIINPGRSASANDIKDLVELCISKVKEQFGIALEREIRYL